MPWGAGWCGRRHAGRVRSPNARRPAFRPLVSARWYKKMVRDRLHTVAVSINVQSPHVLSSRFRVQQLGTQKSATTLFRPLRTLRSFAEVTLIGFLSTQHAGFFQARLKNRTRLATTGSRKKINASHPPQFSARASRRGRRCRGRWNSCRNCVRSYTTRRSGRRYSGKGGPHCRRR